MDFLQFIKNNNNFNSITSKIDKRLLKQLNNYKSRLNKINTEITIILNQGWIEDNLKLKEEMKEALESDPFFFDFEYEIASEDPTINKALLYDSFCLVWNHNHERTFNHNSLLTEHTYSLNSPLPKVDKIGLLIEYTKNPHDIYIGVSTEIFGEVGNFLKDRSKEANVWAICGDGIVNENDEIITSNMSFKQNDVVVVEIVNGLLNVQVNVIKDGNYSFDFGDEELYLYVSVKGECSIRIY